MKFPSLNVYNYYLVSLYFLYLVRSGKILNKNLNYEKSEKNTESQKNSNLMNENQLTKTVIYQPKFLKFLFYY